ncbi:MAG: hypothetical protein G01um10143_521 [Parcubacteria group bacterium Gr01-1014_3]|nr:MAG: hypothetical protein G01um10143_521 [Parcubacteria group bacterium Gr01-1014_3]
MGQQLVRGMYPHVGVGPFGLSIAQMRFEGKVAHNCGWYNKSGEKLGWGDLSIEDFGQISRYLMDDEIFVVLSESATNDFAGALPTEESLQAPGVEYVAENAMFIIAKRRVYRVDDSPIAPKHWRGLIVEILTREAATALIKS